MTNTRRTIGQWFKFQTYCRFWGCQPPDDGSWWTSRSGMVVVTPATKTYCEKCGGPV